MKEKQNQNDDYHVIALAQLSPTFNHAMRPLVTSVHLKIGFIKKKLILYYPWQ